MVDLKIKCGTGDTVYFFNEEGPQKGVVDETKIDIKKGETSINHFIKFQNKENETQVNFINDSCCFNDLQLFNKYTLSKMESFNS